MQTLPGLLAIGFTLGLKHALDADHLAAVASIVGRGAGFLRASRIGLLWGFGHTAALLLLSLVVVIFGVHIPQSWSRWFELLVAIVLLVLGLNLLRHVLRGDRLHIHVHRHGPIVHAHPHFHHGPAAPVNHGPTPGGLKPFLVGLLHGTAGSAAVLLLVLMKVDDPFQAFLFVLVFGLGSVAGMLTMSAVLSLPLAAAARRSAALLRTGQAAVAGLTLLVGARMFWTFLLES